MVLLFNKNIKKFIINRNDKAFYYGEVFSLDGILEFKVYLEWGPVVYNSDSFYDIYGNDKILCISSFLENVKFSVVTSGLGEDVKMGILNFIQNIGKRISKKNYANPSLSNCKGLLLNFLAYYNEIIVFDDMDEGIDFTKEYEKIFKLKKKNDKEMKPVYYENYGSRYKQDVA